MDVKTTLKVFVAGFLSLIEGVPKLCHRKTSVNELRQDPTSTSNSTKSVNDNSPKPVPKQVVDIIDVVNQNQSSGEKSEEIPRTRYIEYCIMDSAPVRCLFSYTDFL